MNLVLALQSEEFEVGRVPLGGTTSNQNESGRVAEVLGKKEGVERELMVLKQKAGLHLVWYGLNDNKKARKETGQRKEQRQLQRHILRIARKEQSVLNHGLRR
jgi:hypothetical protein